MRLGELLLGRRDRVVPASELFRRVPPAPPPAKPSIGEATPFGSEAIPPPPAVAPPPWSDVFPAHHRALADDLRRRGDDLANWELSDGRDLGVSEHGHTVAFTLAKRGTAVVTHVELTLFKGRLASVRVR